MNLVHARLSTRRHRECSFQHWGGAVKLVKALQVRERSDIVVLTIVKTSEARGGVFKREQGSREQFSALGRCCEARSGLFKCRGYPI